MKTLKERLDEKLPRLPLSTLIWKELEEVFLKVEPQDLAKGVTVTVYKNEHYGHFCYNPSTSKSNIGKKFSCNFGSDTLEEVIKIAKENGISVKPTNKGYYYVFIYSPTWPN